MIRDLPLASLSFVHDLVEVGADVLAGRKALHVAVERVLGASRRLPLIGPDDLPARPLERDSEPSDPGE
jgi:hypothetical protein